MRSMVNNTVFTLYGDMVTRLIVEISSQCIYISNRYVIHMKQITVGQLYLDKK